MGLPRALFGLWGFGFPNSGCRIFRFPNGKNSDFRIFLRGVCNTAVNFHFRKSQRIEIQLFASGFSFPNQRPCPGLSSLGLARPCAAAVGLGALGCPCLLVRARSLAPAGSLLLRPAPSLAARVPPRFLCLLLPSSPRFALAPLRLAPPRFASRARRPPFAPLARLALLRFALGIARVSPAAVLCTASGCRSVACLRCGRLRPRFAPPRACIAARLPSRSLRSLSLRRARLRLPRAPPLFYGAISACSAALAPAVR